jgi:phosphatidate cytidylyltransferase
MFQSLSTQFAQKLEQWGLTSYWRTLSQHQQRWVSALCMIALFSFFVWSGGFLFSMMIMMVTLIAYREWLALVQTVWSPTVEYVAYIGIGLALVCSTFHGFDLSIFILLLTFIAQTGLAFLYSDKGDQSAPLWVSAGVLYVGLPALTILWLRSEAIVNLETPQSTLMLMLFVLVWTTDSFAYWVGKSFGKTKLAPSISPNKTREGLFGGIGGAALITVTIAAVFQLPYWPLYALLGGFTGLVSQGGDLFESWVKRRAGVKDSGQIIPGHGGILDRIDGLLFAAPVYALLIKPFIL